MKWLINALVTLVLLTGCANNPFSVHTTPTTGSPVVVAQNAVDQANATIAAAGTALLEANKSGAIVGVQFADLRGKLHQASNYVDTAQSMVKSGDPQGADQTLALANALIGAVQAELVKLKNEGK